MSSRLSFLAAGAMTPSAIIVSMVGVALPVLGGIWLTPKSAPWFLLRPGRSHLGSLRTASQLGQQISLLSRPALQPRQGTRLTAARMERHA
jgi:hypothetical protein